jgi:hypothetical protein
MSSSTEEVTVPALFHHCLQTYEAMLDTAKRVKLDGQVNAIVYEGYLTTLIKEELNLSTPLYTHITRALKKMGCIRQLRRGGGNSKSQWELVKTPTQELFRTEVGETQPHRTRYVTYEQYEMMQQQIVDINRRLNEMSRTNG